MSKSPDLKIKFSIFFLKKRLFYSFILEFFFYSYPFTEFQYNRYHFIFYTLKRQFKD